MIKLCALTFVFILFTNANSFISNSLQLKKCLFLLYSSGRLVLSRFEIEGAPLGENSVESEEDEEEVWLFWKDSNKEIRSKSIRELAQDAKEGQKEDQEVISYYR